MVTVRIEFVKAWGVYAAGRVVDYPHPGAADELVRRGIARAVEVPPPAAPPKKPPRGR